MPPSPGAPDAVAPPPAVVLSAALSLDGFSSGAFTDAVRAVLRESLASELAVAAQSVTVVAVTDVAPARRRLLAAGGITVSLQVAMSGSSPAADVAAKLAALPASAAFLQAFNAGLAAAGVAGRVTAVYVVVGVTSRPPPPRVPAAPAALPQPQTQHTLKAVLPRAIKLLAIAVAAELVFCSALVLLAKNAPERLKQRCADGLHRCLPTCARACRVPQRNKAPLRQMPPSVL